MLKLTDIDQKSPDFIAAINSFARNPKGFFLIAGKNGNGKTFVAQAIFDRFWTPICDNQFWNQADLKIKWQDVLAEYKTTNHLLKDIVNAPLLVLDDIGTTRPSEAFMEFLYIITDKRYNSKDSCGTIITTNLNSDMMREIFGDAFLSRVSSGICIRHDGPDRRCSKF